MTERYAAMEAAWKDLERARLKVTAVHWTPPTDLDHLSALMREADKFKEAVSAQWMQAYYDRPIEAEAVGVHASHCCTDHGCKYGNKRCPVVNREVAQEYPCEACAYEEE